MNSVGESWQLSDCEESNEQAVAGAVVHSPLSRSRSRSRSPHRDGAASTSVHGSDDEGVGEPDVPGARCSLVPGMAAPDPLLDVLPGTAWWARPLYHALEHIKLRRPQFPRRPMSHASLCSGTMCERFGYKAFAVINLLRAFWLVQLVCAGVAG
jgi:hypothetical protein